MSKPVTHNERLHTKDYFTEFNTNGYLEAYNYFEMIPWFVKHLKELVRVFVQNSADLGHNRALEFGGGPTLVSSFVLAQYVQSITFSEYMPSNLKAVEDWMNRSEDAHDWTNVFSRVVEEYRQQTGVTIAIAEWEERLRTALQRGGLLPIGDVNERCHCPVLDNQANHNHFDIVLSSFCLEGACLAHDTFESTVKRLYTLLKPGGFLLLAHARNQTFYCVTGKRFYAQPINEQSVHETMERAGLVNVQITTIERSPDIYSDADGYFIACGNKVK